MNKTKRKLLTLGALFATILLNPNAGFGKTGIMEIRFSKNKTHYFENGMLSKEGGKWVGRGTFWSPRTGFQVNGLKIFLVGILV